MPNHHRPAAIRSVSLMLSLCLSSIGHAQETTSEPLKVLPSQGTVRAQIWRHSFLEPALRFQGPPALRVPQEAAALRDLSIHLRMPDCRTCDDRTRAVEAPASPSVPESQEGQS
jgi:hypothetical protein